MEFEACLTNSRIPRGSNHNEKDTVGKTEAGAGYLGYVLYYLELYSEGIGKLFKNLQGVQLILTDAGTLKKEGRKGNNNEAIVANITNDQAKSSTTRVKD